MNLLEELQLPGPIQVMDVGASVINEVPVYKALLDSGAAHLHAFEGDERQIAGIEQAYGGRATVHRDFLFDGEERTLFLASGPSGMTSLLNPRLSALRFFNGFEFFGRIERTMRVQTRRLDDVETVPPLDFVKMDIQGGELTVMKHGLAKLHDCVAVQLEVSFVGLYENQPPIGEVDMWMRQQGFAPHCFVDVKRWAIAPTVFMNNFRVPGNQLLEADMVYVKDPLKLAELSVAQLKKLAALAHYCFQSYDLCVFVLLELEARGAVREAAHQRYLGGGTSQAA
ncbi:MAG: FkbM family methyltransferase [Aestuariivirga sp.]|uniref:FkbM family methyltransferase n=1 Tax=Aestuariivirga sp. TaxID=2650926 RepID=UPI0038D029C4